MRVMDGLLRLGRPLASRKVRVALATVLAAYAAEWGLGVSEEMVLTILGVGAALSLESPRGSGSQAGTGESLGTEMGDGDARGSKWAVMAMLQLVPVISGAVGCGGDARPRVGRADALAVDGDRLEVVGGRVSRGGGGTRRWRELRRWWTRSWLESGKPARPDEQVVADTAQFRLAWRRSGRNSSSAVAAAYGATENWPWFARWRRAARMGIESLTLGGRDASVT